MSTARFAVLAENKPKTVSVYRAPAGTDRVCFGDTIFPVDDLEAGTIALPDFVGRQLELKRIGRHAAIESFDVVNGELVLLFYPGKGPNAERERTDAELVAERERVDAELKAVAAQLLAEEVDATHDVALAMLAAEAAENASAAAAAHAADVAGDKPADAGDGSEPAAETAQPASGEPAGEPAAEPTADAAVTATAVEPTPAGDAAAPKGGKRAGRR